MAHKHGIVGDEVDHTKLHQRLVAHRTLAEPFLEYVASSAYTILRMKLAPAFVQIVSAAAAVDHGQHRSHPPHGALAGAAPRILVQQAVCQPSQRWHQCARRPQDTRSM